MESNTDEALTQYLQTVVSKCPGFAGSIVIGDQVVWMSENCVHPSSYAILETLGLADVRDEHSFVTEDTRFLVASISKLITGMAALQLHEAGLLDLNEDINEYIEVKVYHPSGHPITAKHLLQHK